MKKLVAVLIASVFLIATAAALLTINQPANAATVSASTSEPATTTFRDIPYTFVTGRDGTIYFHKTGMRDWVSAGNGGSVSGAPAVTSTNNLVFVVVKGTDGNYWSAASPDPYNVPFGKWYGDGLQI